MIALHLAMTVINLFDLCPRNTSQERIPFGELSFPPVSPAPDASAGLLIKHATSICLSYYITYTYLYASIFTDLTSSIRCCKTFCPLFLTLLQKSAYLYKLNRMIGGIGMSIFSITEKSLGNSFYNFGKYLSESSYA